MGPVDIDATEPGQRFTLAVKFPAGFQLKQGEKAEVRVKTDHPRFGMIKVPVVQNSQ